MLFGKWDAILFIGIAIVIAVGITLDNRNDAVKACVAQCEKDAPCITACAVAFPPIFPGLK